MNHNLRILIGSALALLATTSSGRAQKISFPEKPVPEHSLVRLEVDDPQGASWLVLPAERADVVEADGGKRLVFSGPPGDYTVLAAVVAEGKPRILRADVSIQPREPGPSPPADSPPADSSPASPANDPPPAELDRAAKSYGQAIPSALLEAAALIRSGKITHVNQAIELVADRREQARKAYGQALDAAAAGGVDPSGKIVGPSVYADALERAARAMGANP